MARERRAGGGAVRRSGDMVGHGARLSRGPESCNVARVSREAPRSGGTLRTTPVRARASRSDRRRRARPSQLPRGIATTMSSLAFVFPGQGSQSVGMGRALAAASPGRGRGLRRGRRRRSASPSPALACGGPGRGAGPDRERPAGAPGRLDRLPPRARGAPRRRRPGAARPGLLRRPLDGPVQRHGRRRRHLAWPTALRLVRERGRLMQASGEGSPGAMAAIIGLDDERLAGAGGGRRRARASSRSPTATRPARSWSAASAAAVEAAAEAAKGLGAKRAIVLPVSVAAHSPLMAERRRRDARPRSPTSRSATRRAAAGQRGRAPADHRRGLPRGARRAPDDAASTGSRAVAGDGRGRRRHASSRSAPARSSPASSGASRPTPRPSPSTTRRPGRLADPDVAADPDLA